MGKEESDALVSLYNSTNGPAWTGHTNWLLALQVCDWHGLTCTPGWGVTRLNLVGNHLQGTLPAELGALTALQQLELGNNALSGPLPPELISAQKMSELDVSGNGGLSGPAPLVYADVFNLTRFWFNGTQLCEPPENKFQDWLTRHP